MAYVSVPVPEEHVEDVMRFVLRAMARASMLAWDDEAFADLWSDTDELGRSLLAFVARATLEDVDLTDREAAEKVQVRPREVHALAAELSQESQRRRRPPIVTTQMVEDELPNGRVVEVRVLLMDAEVARLVADAERSELAGHQTLGEA
jgi:hypothetical protein